MDKPTRIFDFIYYQQAKFPQEKAFSKRGPNGWVSFSTKEVVDKINQVSRGLLKLGVQPGDNIATVVNRNRPEWIFLDGGINQIGAINVPLYASISAKEYVYILNDAEIKWAFVGDGDLYEKVNEAKNSVPTLKEIYTFDLHEGRKFYEELLEKDTAGDAEVKRRMDAIKISDLATIIYTSGTTGKPKGVRLSHENISSNAWAVSKIPPLDPGDRVLSFLPICHVFERTATYMYIGMGLSIYNAGMDNLGGEGGDIRAAEPHFFTAVPRLLEKVYEKIIAKGNELSGIKKKLFFWAVSLTDDYDYDKEYTGLAKIKRSIADKLIFSKWREAMGGHVKGIFCGSAPLPAKMARVFSAAGIPIREGYGLTETSPGLTLGYFGENGAKIGYIGPALDGVELLIDDSEGEYNFGEGEVLAKGPNIMMGYHKMPEETAKVFKEVNGVRWFRTGDIGRMDDIGKGRRFLKITDRKKELLKTSGGKYVAPAPIESKMKESFLIEQIMVVGDGKKFVSALIVPSFDGLKNWCKENGVSYTTAKEALKEEKVVKEYERIIEKFNPEFSHVEQIKKITLLPGEWLPIQPNGAPSELTPTLKLKRRVIAEKFRKEIAEMYEA